MEKEAIIELIKIASIKLKNPKSRLIIKNILSNHIKDLFEILVELDQDPQKIFGRYTNLSRGYVECSKNDLYPCKILYKENEHHSLAIYHLQQSIEKLTKAYGLSFGFTSRNELQKAGHTSPLIFLTLCQKKITKKYIGLSDIFEELNTKKIVEYCKKNSIQVAGKLPYDTVVTKAMIHEQNLIEFSDGGLSGDIAYM